jgi:hypothetical protein
MKVSVLARMRRARRGAMLSTGGMLVTTGVLLVVMTPGLAVADTNQCGYGNSAGNVRTCVSVGYSSAEASVHVVSSARVLDLCLYINSRSQCSGYTYVPAGQSMGEDYQTLGGEVPSATFCAVTWKKQPDGSVVLVDQECESLFHG